MLHDCAVDGELVWLLGLLGHGFEELLLQARLSAIRLPCHLSPGLGRVGIWVHTMMVWFQTPVLECSYASTLPSTLLQTYAMGNLAHATLNSPCGLSRIAYI